VEQVREIMGRNEETPNGRFGKAGEFERTWIVDDAAITIVFDRDGRSCYREFGPSFCGVTPLGGRGPRNPDPNR
jgi:hypothetical protein